MKRIVFAVSTWLFVASGWPSLEAAEPSRQRAKPKQSCQLISRSEAISRAKAKSKGKVVSVKLKRAGAKSVYHVRVLVGEKRIKNYTIKACK